MSTRAQTRDVETAALRRTTGSIAGFFCCRRCGCKAPSSADAKKHAMVHLPNTVKPFSCSLCRFTSKDDGYVQLHIATVHKNNMSGKVVDNSDQFEQLISSVYMSCFNMGDVSSNRLPSVLLNASSLTPFNSSNISLPSPSVSSDDDSSAPSPTTADGTKTGANGVRQSVRLATWTVRCKKCGKSIARGKSDAHVQLHMRETTDTLRCSACDYTGVRADRIKSHIIRSHQQATVIDIRQENGSLFQQVRRECFPDDQANICNKSTDQWQKGKENPSIKRKTGRDVDDNDLLVSPRSLMVSPLKEEFVQPCPPPPKRNCMIMMVAGMLADSQEQKPIIDITNSPTMQISPFPASADSKDNIRRPVGSGTDPTRLMGAAAFSRSSSENVAEDLTVVQLLADDRESNLLAEIIELQNQMLIGQQLRSEQITVQRKIIEKQNQLMHMRRIS